MAEYRQRKEAFMLTQKPVSALEWALTLAERGCYLFPLKPRTKLPLMAHWQTNNSRDKETLTRWSEQFPDCNFAVYTGLFGFDPDTSPDESLCVVDVDVKQNKRGLESLLSMDLDFDLPQTFTVRTPSGGLHLYFLAKDPIKNAVDILYGKGCGIDIRGVNGYVVAPGSLLQDLETDPLEPYTTVSDTPFAYAPQNLLQNLHHHTPTPAPVFFGPATLQPLAVVPDIQENIKRALAFLKLDCGATEGFGGDEHTFRVAAQLKDFGVSEATALTLLLEAWNPKCSPPWEPEDLQRKVANAFAYGKHAFGVATPEADFQGVNAGPTLENTRQQFLAGLDPNGKGILGSATNIYLALGRSDVCGYSIAKDEFLNKTMVCEFGKEQWRDLRDTDYNAIRRNLEKASFLKIQRRDIVDGVEEFAEKHSFDSAQKWLKSIPAWDGAARVAKFYHRYFRAEDTEYAEEVSKYTWTALVGRIVRPGIQADMVPLLVGGQGVGKTRGVEAMVPDPCFCGQLSFEDNKAEQARKIQGKIIVEICEMQGFGKRDLENIKAVITQGIDTWTPKYKEHAVSRPRRNVWVGTTNEPELLSDPTGNRRWLPLTCSGKVDVFGIKRDHLQIWAEAKILFEKHGVIWQKVAKLAEHEHDRYKRPNDIKEILLDWWNKRHDYEGLRPIPDASGAYSWGELMKYVRQQSQGLTVRVTTSTLSAALKDLRFVKKQLENKRVWFPPEEENQTEAVDKIPVDIAS